MTEAELQASIIEATKLLGLIAYHTRSSVGSEPGWPDLTIVGAERVLFRELKSTKGRLSVDQTFWMDALRDAGMDVAIWRPEQWPQQILDELRTLGRVQVARPAPTPAQLRRRAARRGQRRARPLR